MLPLLNVHSSTEPVGVFSNLRDQFQVFNFLILRVLVAKSENDTEKLFIKKGELFNKDQTQKNIPDINYSAKSIAIVQNYFIIILIDSNVQ